MSLQQFNFSQLNNVYADALNSNDKSLVFEIAIGKGHFLFMMFLSIEDKDARDKLFVYLRNTNTVVKVKLYGNHRKGQFIMYITDDIQNKFCRELQLQANDGSFDFMRFLDELNGSIPLDINTTKKLNDLRRNHNVVSRLGVIDEAEKTVLISPRYVSNGFPRDRTLRKLYTYTDADYKDIDTLIELLKLQNMTVAWTTPERAKNPATVQRLLSELTISN